MTDFWSIILFALDWAVVYALMYVVLLQALGTRMFEILILAAGLALVFILLNLPWLRLHATSSILNVILINAPLLVIILFQQDIRWGLVKLAQKNWLQERGEERDTSVAEELVQSCARLSEAMRGGLIVIERAADLSQYANEGVQLDASLSWELMYAIFDPGDSASETEERSVRALAANPLHDGAVIVRSGRVLAAGCFLPLTTNPAIEKSLGTRHRAAIGVSEQSDAIVLVVSEETGKMSIAVSGHLDRFVEVVDFRAKLYQLMGNAPPKGRPS